MKNHFLLRVFITHYLLHSLKCTFCKNLDERNGKSRLRQYLVEFQSNVVLATLRYVCYVSNE